MRGMEAVFLCCAVAAIPGCSREASRQTGGVKHIVLCWLKQPGSTEAREKVIAASNELRAIPGLIDLAVGGAVPSDREIVDDSFDVGLVMTFADEVGMSRYLVHPEHVASVRTVFGPLTKRILVYDIRCTGNGSR